MIWRIVDLFNRKKVMARFVAVLSLLLVFACGSSGEAEKSSENTSPAPISANKLSGTIEIDGSSTVYPVSEAVAEDFGKSHKDVRVNVGVSGTGGGFKRFTSGETDISNASRLIRQMEVDAANDNGVKYHVLKIGTDGLSVIVNLSNTWVDCLTVEELKNIWEPGSMINNWNQVRASFPNQKMRLYCLLYTSPSPRD